ncbi:hypothetical protein CLOM621_08221 [Clostridium sp. M62/1]|nr:hypothetical protein CLOM621_08221 [Clostridium sp. M62/1]
MQAGFKHQPKKEEKQCCVHGFSSFFGLFLIKYAGIVLFRLHFNKNLV